MPKLTAVVDSLDSVAEPLRDLYAKREDGKYQLDADVEEHSAVRGLKSAHEAQKKETRDAKAEAQQYKGLGLTTEEIAALVKEKRERDEKQAKDAGQWDSLKTQLLETHKGELGKREQRIQGLTKTIDKTLRENAAIAEVAKVAPRGVTLLLPHIMASTRLIEDEATGEFAVAVVDAKGNPRIGGADGKPMTIAQLVEEMKGLDDFAGAFPGSGASGSGAAGSTTTAAGAADLSRLSPEARLAYARERGLK